MPRLYSPIEPGVDDQSRWPVKGHALTEHLRGVPLTELPEIWAESVSTATVVTTIGANQGAVASQIGDPVDYTRDAIHIEWYRSTDLMYAVTLGVYDVQRVPESSAGDTLDDTTSLPLGDNIAGENRGFRLGRKSGNQLMIQQDENADVTLTQNDEIRTRYATYDNGVLGGKFRKLIVPSDHVIWLKRRASAQPGAPTGVTYSGTSVGLPAAVTTAGWVLLGDTNPTGSAPIWYARATADYDHDTATWTVGAFTVLSFPDDRAELALEITFSSTRTGARHAPPQVDADLFAHFRLNTNDPVQTVQIREDSDPPWTYPSTVVRWTPTTMNNTYDYNMVTPVALDSYAFMNLLIRTDPMSDRSAFPIILPTNALFSSISTSYSWVNTVSYVVAINRTGVSHFRIDDATQPTPDWNGFSFYLFRNSADDIRTMRGLRMFDPTDTSGNRGMTFTISFH